jgi:hypothetical protein
MAETPITLQALGLESWSDLYALSPQEVLTQMSERDVPLHAGDAFLAVIVLRAVSDLAAASSRLDAAARFYRFAGFVLAFVATAAAVVTVVQAT